ncbi:MAG: hypothetical protein JXR51_08925, partial [Bacteroidales bacterium]|nr:hypothetical protein [Bacteroidales bacterium]
MSKANLNIEELFQKSFNDYKIKPSLNVWNKINKKLNVNQFFKFNLSKINIYYIAFSTALILSILFYSTNNLDINTAQKINNNNN